MYQAGYLRYIPFVMLVIPLGLGIWCADYFRFEAFEPFLAFCVVSFFLLVGLIVTPAFYLKFRWRWMQGVVLALFLFFAGVALTVHKMPSVIHEPGKVKALAVVKKQDLTSGGYHRLTVEAVGVFQDSHLAYKRGDLWQVITNSPSSPGEVSPAVNDTILMEATISGPQPVTNPHAFNYSRYLLRQGIAGSAFVPYSNLQIRGRGTPRGVAEFMEEMRQLVKSVYFVNGINGDELNVLTALTLGIREELDPDVKSRFVRSGAVHILAVSGLHTGIVFLMLNAFLSLFLPRRSLLRLLFILGGLWFFAILTGGAPSVFRAVIMFSVIQVGLFVNRRTNIYNLLGISAFIILFISPLSLFNAGFWLSHLAVAGIVTLFPLLSGLMAGGSIFLRWVWDLTSVSLAAQLATFPLSIFLFHAFPVYFLLTNLFVLPLVAPIIVLSILLVLFSRIFFVAQMVATPLNEILVFMNKLIAWLDTLPGAYRENIWVSAPMMLSFYLFIILLLLFIEFKNRHFLKLSLAALAVIFGALNVQYLSKVNTNTFAVFDAGKDNIVGSVFAGQGYLWSSPLVTGKKQSFVADAYFTRKTLSVTRYFPGFDPASEGDSSFVVFPVKSGCFLGVYAGNVDAVYPDEISPLRGVVIMNKVEGDLALLLQRLECKNLIISSACPSWWVAKWKDGVLETGVSVYDVSKEGAFVEHF